MPISSERFLNHEMSSSEPDFSLTPESTDISENLARQYRAKYEAIIHTPLTPENITTYASDALDKYVGLLEDAHGEISISIDDYSIETEKAVAEKFLGLNNPWDIQQHIKSVQTDIDKLFKRVADAKISHTSNNYVPPNSAEATEIIPSDGLYEENPVTPRTATILFLLEHDFAINLDDPEQFSINSGATPINAMRNEPYNKIEVKPLERLILVCDQKGNRTFVFDTSKFGALGLTTEQIAQMNKPELDTFIEQYSGLGSSLTYTKNFIDNISELIRDPATPVKNDSETVKDYSYLELLPDKPGDYEFYTDVFNAYGLTKKALNKWIKSGKLGDVKKFHRPGYKRGTYALSPEQQEVLAGLDSIDFQNENRSVNPVKMPPEKTLSVKDICELFNCSRTVVYGAIKRLKESGVNLNGRMYKFGPMPALGYGPAAQEEIRRQIVLNDSSAPKAPDGVLSAKGMAAAFGVDRNTVAIAIGQLKENGVDINGEIYKFHSYSAMGYDIKAQEQIKKQLENNGVFVEKAPEGALSVKKLSKKLGASAYLIFSAIRQLEEEGVDLGGKVYRFHSQNTMGYNDKAQEQIKERLVKNGAFIDSPPKGVLSAQGIASLLGVHRDHIVDIIRNLSENGVDLHGKPYRFGGNAAIGYDEKAQELIKGQMEIKPPHKKTNLT